MHGRGGGLSGERVPGDTGGKIDTILEEAASGDHFRLLVQLEEHEMGAAHDVDLAVPRGGLPETDLVDLLLLQQEVGSVEIVDGDPSVHSTRSSPRPGRASARVVGPRVANVLACVSVLPRSRLGVAGSGTEVTGRTTSYTTYSIGTDSVKGQRGDRAGGRRGRE